MRSQSNRWRMPEESGAHLDDPCPDIGWSVMVPLVGVVWGVNGASADLDDPDIERLDSFWSREYPATVH